MNSLGGPCSTDPSGSAAGADVMAVAAALVAAVSAVLVLILDCARFMICGR